MEKASTTTLVMKRLFEVAPERVFDAWLNPDMMCKW
ncbi:SRPBCC domain-containing protein, partial [Clostridium perfringens]